jgi:dolichol-phosphate mannosyltransferase
MNNDLMIHSLRGPILVLGAGGFIGANLVRQLLRVRKDVFAIVRSYPTWRLAEVADTHILEVDITDGAAVRNLLRTINPQTVFNCTAYGAYSFEKNPVLIHRTNYTAIVDFVEQLSQQSFAAFVHAGSSSEYGTNCAGPDETSELRPNSQYAVSKVATAHYLEYCGKFRNLPVVNLRLYSVYGPLEDTARLIPNVLIHALRGGYPDFVHSEISRDFVYIDDVCRAFILAAAQMNPSMYGRSFNIGTGEATTIRSLALQTKTLYNLQTEPTFATIQPREWDLVNWYANPQLAAKQLGWTALYTLQDGLLATQKWIEHLSNDDFMQMSKQTAATRKKSVSAIVACYKDALAIPYMHRRLTETFMKIGCPYEIIFVNDCSPDNSLEVIQSISAIDPNVLGISHSRNFGSQMAFRSGMELSNSDAVVFLDGDLQDPPELIADFYQQWELGFDVVYGRRIQREMPWIWEVMYKMFYLVFATFSYIPIPRDAGDFSLIDKKVVKWLLLSQERDLFIRGLRAYMGFKQGAVNYVRPERMFGVSTNNFLKNLNWAKMAFFSYSNAPLNLLSTVGLLLTIASVVFMLVMVAIRLFFPSLVLQGVTTILLMVLFFGSINLLGIAVLGEYIGKIVIEVKQRPRLIRSAIIRNGVVNVDIPNESQI